MHVQKGSPGSYRCAHTNKMRDKPVPCMCVQLTLKANCFDTSIVYFQASGHRSTPLEGRISLNNVRVILRGDLWRQQCNRHANSAKLGILLLLQNSFCVSPRYACAKMCWCEQNCSLALQMLAVRTFHLIAAVSSSILSRIALFSLEESNKYSDAADVVFY